MLLPLPERRALTGLGSRLITNSVRTSDTWHGVDLAMIPFSGKSVETCAAGVEGRLRGAFQGAL